MDLRYSAEEQDFRHELRGWLEETVAEVGPEPDRNDWPGRRDYDTGWQKVLFGAGYAGINWPVEHGGRGASPTEHLIFLEEAERAKAPYVGMNFVGLLHAGPTLIVEAGETQKQDHLEAILRGDHVWCQGFSEPNAGSDLASLSCRAVRDGNEFVVSGQKIWTSFAHVADYCELLVRTDTEAPKHRGISWLIMDMNSAGVDTRPLRTLEGSAEFCEMFLDEVRVPESNLVGELNDGWRVAMTTLSFERGTAFVSEMLQTKQLCSDLASLATLITSRAATAWDDRELRRELGKVTAELDGLWALTKRNISEATRSGLVGTGGSVFKLAYAELRHSLGEISMRLLGRASLSMDDVGELPTGRHVQGQIHGLSMSIAAGTTQVQKNIIAERVLGLPKEPKQALTTSAP